jgi:YD repeat-containing protein
MTKYTACLLVVFGCWTVSMPAQEHPSSEIASTPQWEKIKSLAGEWDGYAMENGQKMTTHITIRMTGGGSALMHWMDAGSPHEMITMFHMDKSDLLATHYCAAHNQPRMRATASDKPNQIAFDFLDGTNIRPGDGFMRQLTIDFVDADHHNETWGYDAKGKIQSGTFYMTRTKQPPKSKP